MNAEALLARAIELAHRAHAGQVDKGGKPYIEHPLRVMEAVSTPEQKIVAVLHDVLEDTAVTAAELAEWLPPHLLQAVQALSKKPHEAYLEFIDRVCATPLAIPVKIADIIDNLDLSRLPEISADDEARVAKYHKVLAVLTSFKG